MIQIDGRSFAAHGTVLDVCREAGAPVAAFCHDNRLSTGGHCRACLVEVNGRIVAACATAAEDESIVITDSPRLAAYHRDLAELMLSESSPAGPVGPAFWARGGDPVKVSVGPVVV